MQGSRGRGSVKLWEQAEHWKWRHSALVLSILPVVICFKSVESEPNKEEDYTPESVDHLQEERKSFESRLISQKTRMTNIDKEWWESQEVATRACPNILPKLRFEIVHSNGEYMRTAGLGEDKSGTQQEM